MTIDQTLEGIFSLLLEIRNNTRPSGTEAISIVDMYPPGAALVATAPPTKVMKKTAKAAPIVETAAPAAAPSAASAATPESTLTLDDVRAALVQAQTRFGSKAKPQEVLSKYSKTGTTGGLDKADYSRVIAECTAL